MFNFTIVVFDGTSPTFYFTNTSGWNTSSSVKKGVHLEEKYVGGWIILKVIFKFEWEEVKWIGLAQDGDNLCDF